MYITRTRPLDYINSNPLPYVGGGFGLGFGGRFKMCHFTRSNVAIESSTDECPTLPPPLWIVSPRCSRALHGIQRRQQKKEDLLQIPQRLAVGRSSRMFEN